MSAPRLYIITDRHATGGRPLVDVIRQALAGVDGRGHEVAVQLREKDLDGRALLGLALALREVTREVGAALYVNDRADVALASGADGVHLGGGALPPERVHGFAPHLKVAVSTHAPDEVAQAARSDVSFAVFGPVFATPSKRALGDPQGIDRLAQACSQGLHVLALGGISPSDVQACRQAGAWGVACIRAVLGAPDPSRAVHEFLRR